MNKLAKSLEAHAEETAEGIREYCVGMYESTQKLKLWLCYRYVDSRISNPGARDSIKELEAYLSLAPIKEMFKKMNYSPATHTVENWLVSYRKNFAPILEKKKDFETAFQQAVVNYGLKILDAPRKQSKKEVCSGVTKCEQCGYYGKCGRAAKN